MITLPVFLNSAHLEFAPPDANTGEKQSEQRALKPPLRTSLLAEGTGHLFAIALVSNNCSKEECHVLVRAISATGAHLLFDTGSVSAGAIATECSVR